MWFLQWPENKACFSAVSFHPASPNNTLWLLTRLHLCWPSWPLVSMRLNPPKPMEVHQVIPLISWLLLVISISPFAKWRWQYFLPASQWGLGGLVLSLQQCLSGRDDYKEQDVQLHWRGSKLRVSRYTYIAEQLADELSWPLHSNQISAQLAHLWATLISHVRTSVSKGAIR